MSTLHLGKGFDLPREALLHVWSLLGVRGAGKTYNASVIVEEILERKMMPVVVIDPMDVWWGLKSSADGKSAGYPVIVMGGTHADVPLEPTSGAVVADFFIEHRQSAILVFADGQKRWPTAQQVRFVADFGARLYERNAGQLMFLVVDEADIFANQRPGKDELRCLGVMEHIVKRGRTPGIMPLMITQRSSNLNKNVLDETEMLVALRTSSPRDQDALDSWFRHLPKVQAARRETLLATWAKLPNGTAWFWCPSMDLFQQIQVRQRRTFNSSATPAFGEKPKEPKVLAPVDLEALKQRMAATIERANQMDPKRLQNENARLRADLRKVPVPVATRPIIEKVRVPIFKDGQLTRLEQAVGKWLKGIDLLVDVSKTLGGRAHELQTVIAAAHRNGDAATVRQPAHIMPTKPPQPPRALLTPRGPIARSVDMPPVSTKPSNRTLIVGERRILVAIAQHPDGVTREQLTVLTGYKRSSRDTYLQRLQQRGLVTTQHDRLVATQEGVDALGRDYEPLPVGDALRDYWMHRLPEGERRVFELVVAAHPRAVDREQISDTTGYKRSSRDTYLQRLGARRLVLAEGRGAVRASEDLF